MEPDHTHQEITMKRNFREKLILTIVGASIIAGGIVAGRIVRAHHFTSTADRMEREQEEQYKIMVEKIEKTFSVLQNMESMFEHGSRQSSWHDQQSKQIQAEIDEALPRPRSTNRKAGQ